MKFEIDIYSEDVAIAEVLREMLLDEMNSKAQLQQELDISINPRSS